jgi:hypothetical protein
MPKNGQAFLRIVTCYCIFYTESLKCESYFWICETQSLHYWILTIASPVELEDFSLFSNTLPLCHFLHKLTADFFNLHILRNFKRVVHHKFLKKKMQLWDGKMLINLLNHHQLYHFFHLQNQIQVFVWLIL